MTDSHLNALELRRSHEIGYHAKAKTENERELRKVWIAQLDAEIARERAFLGLPDVSNEPEMTMDEILAELDA